MMISAVLVLAAAQLPLGPTVPPGANAYFQEAVLQVEEKLAAGDFKGAEAAASILPKPNVRVAWDDSNVPVQQRAEYAAARDSAFRQFGISRSVKFEIVTSSPDLKFAFVPELPKLDGAALPQAAVFLPSTDPEDSRIEAVIALKRGSPLQTTEAVEVHNEVLHAAGLYLGLAPSPFLMGGMGRSDAAGMGQLRMSLGEVNIVNRLVAISEELRQAVAKKTRLQPARPKVMVEPGDVKLKDAVQGEAVPFTVQVNNNGNAPLQVRVNPDCGCLTATPVFEVGAGETYLLKAQIDTTEFVGDLYKRLILFTNDADSPTREVPITIKVEPRFRLLSPTQGLVLAGEGALEADIFLFSPDGTGIEVSSARLDGLPGNVSFERWMGELADPELKEPAKARKGYRIRVQFDENLPPGRNFSTVTITTTDPKFKELRYNFSVQRGIVALPDQVYLGEIPANQPRRASFLVSLPNRDFSIEKIESDNPRFTATSMAIRGSWEHKVTVQYDGRGEAGPVEGMITIHTNNPTQPILRVPVKGTAR